MYDRKPTRQGHRKIRWARLFLVLCVFFLFLGLIAGAASYAYLTAHEPAYGDVKGDKKTAETLNRRVNILLLGIDDGDNESPGAPKRSDTLILAGVNPKNGTINLLSIPRDTKVTIPGRKGVDKIAHAYAYGGADLSKRTVEQFLQVPIDYCVVANWQGFMRAVDILGGVDLYVEQDMNYKDPYANLDIQIKKGFQHLDGNKAGEYVRFRHDELGDIGRVQRQQRFLQALNDELFSIGTIFKLPALTSTIKQYVATDMPAMTMLKLANSIKGFKSGDLKTEMLPGKFATIDGVSYWVPNTEQTSKLVETMFELTLGK